MNFTFENKEAGKLTTRVQNDASSTFSDGIFKLSGNLQDINSILDDLIFVPNENFVENFNISIRIKNSNNLVLGKIELFGQEQNDPPTNIILSYDRI